MIEENLKDGKARLFEFLEPPMKVVVSTCRASVLEENFDAAATDLPTLLKDPATCQILSEDESANLDDPIEVMPEVTSHRKEFKHN